MTSPLDASPDPLLTLEPHRKATVREIFGVDSDMVVPVFTERDSHVPEIDDAYRFDPQTTIAICAGFAFDRRVMVQGYHGTGKSTHIEQVA
ncbi:MAG: cobaltochelatase subunit CobS, partial [Alphaproteobacteria bacterium]|nr:cobaltochelatase subunit CobS [Alphaproteobacteria bacterium]